MDTILTHQPAPENPKMSATAILIVEDSQGLNRLIQKRLKREGFTTLQAFTGADALTTLGEQAVDLMLLDYILPDMTAQQVIEALMGRVETVPFVVMTGQGDEQVAVDMMKLGARDYIVKQGNFIEILPEVVRRIRREIAQEEAFTRAEAGRRELERQFRATLENVQLVGVMLDTEGRITFCNDYFLKLTGWAREKALGADWFQQFLPADIRQSIKSIFLRTVQTGDFPPHYEHEILTRQGERRMIRWSTIVIRDAGGAIIGTNSLGEDITEQKYSQQCQELTAQVLALLNRTDEQPGLIRNILRLIQNFSGVEAIGIRIQEAPDYPYYETIGFDEDFLQDEQYLCVYDQKGTLIRDDDGEPMLECFCGYVLAGKIRATRSHFTPGGSLWINSTTAFLTRITPEELQICTRKRCIEAGYESVTLIPLRSDNRIIGLLQLCDQRPNMFTRDMIAFFEKIGASIGIAIARKKAGETLLQLRKAVETMHIGVTITDRDRKIIYSNPADAAMHGYTIDELLGQDASMFAPSELQRSITFEEIESTRHWIRESLNIRKDGSRFPVQLSSDVVRDADGQAIALVTTCEDITERKRAEEMLRHDRNLLRTLIDNLPDSIFVKDTDGRYLLNNRAHARHLGAQTPEELIGTTVFDHYPQEIAEQYHATDQELLRTGQPIVNHREPLWPLEGESQWRLLTKLPLLDSHGAITGLVGISRNITEQKHAEEALRQQAHDLGERVKELKCLFQISHLIESEATTLEDIFVQTARFLPPAWQYPDMTGARILVNGQEFRTDNFLETPWMLKHDILVNNTRVGSVEVVYLEERPAHDEGPFLREEVDLINTIAERLGDVIRRKQAEEALKFSEQKYRTLFETMAQGVVYQNAEGQIFSANPAAEKILGLTLAQMQGTTSMDPRWKAIHEDGSDFSGDTHPAVLALKTGQRINNVVMGVFHPLEEDYRWISVNAIPQFRPGEDLPYQVYTTFTDISGQKRAMEELRQARDLLEQRVAERTAELTLLNAELARASRLKDEFLANMSHDLRTPLNAILGYAQILQEAGDIPERHAKALATIQQSGQHLLTLIKDILDLAKIEAGRLELQNDEVYLPGFLIAIADMIRVKAEQKGIIFEFEAEPTLPDGIVADEKRLREVLLNLLGNAVKFTEQGTVKFTVRSVRFSEQEKSDKSLTTNLRFEVEDTGIGISQDQLENIFAPFQQTGEQRYQMEGAGLGLAISRRLVKLMHGELHVESVLGQGSLFWLEIPVSPLSGFIPPSPSPKEPKISGYRGPRCHILIIDDQSTNREVLRSMLEPLGFEICEAENGHAGFDCYRQEAPDAILLDLFMPRMDGFELTERIRELETGSRTVLIAISASASGEIQQQSLQVGCDDFLSKPFQQDELLALLKRHLNLEWVYAEGAEIHAEGMHPEPDTEEVLLHISEEDRQELLQQAIRGNVKALLAHLHRIEQGDAQLLPAITVLRKLAEGFQVDRLVELLEQLEREAL